MKFLYQKAQFAYPIVACSRTSNRQTRFKKIDCFIKKGGEFIKSQSTNVVIVKFWKIEDRENTMIIRGEWLFETSG